MKIRSFAMIAMSGIMAASLAYVAPVMADDSAAGQSMEQAPASTDNGASQAQGNSDAPAATAPDSSTGNSGSSAPDQATPDTATGDDDY